MCDLTPLPIFKIQRLNYSRRSLLIMRYNFSNISMRKDVWGNTNLQRVVGIVKVVKLIVKGINKG